MSTPTSQMEIANLNEYLKIDYRKSPRTVVQAGFAAMAGYEVRYYKDEGHYEVIDPRMSVLMTKFPTREDAWRAAYDHLVETAKKHNWTVQEVMEREA